MFYKKKHLSLIYECFLVRSSLKQAQGLEAQGAAEERVTPARNAEVGRLSSLRSSACILGLGENKRHVVHSRTFTLIRCFLVHP